MLLVEGSTIAYESADKSKMPKDFFDVLVKKDWRKWTEAVKKELQGWIDNEAVKVVPIEEVPANAKVVPLGELYSIKRDGRYKYRQYLMGNLLREGVDFGNTFSTTVSSSGLCTFYSLATTCRKEVYGWDAVCGYLQVKEQYDIYSYLPSHHGYSELGYEELGKLRQSFLKLVEDEGEEGLRRFARNQKRDTRSNPTHVYKCEKSVYGGPGCGNAFEGLMHSVHIKTAGMTQTQPEPSIFVKIKVDTEDKVVGYLVVMFFVDDVRFFGTDPELAKYKEDVVSRMNVTFEDPPVSEFVSIETYQDMEYGICELKMPTYFRKASMVFREYAKKGYGVRTVPLTVYDENILLEESSPEQISAAIHLPYLQIVGVLSYPASQCKFEMRYAISLLGSKRKGWSIKDFEVAMKVLEYGLHTCEIGLMYSTGLDPHGQNIVYAYGDANHRLPRPRGYRIVMMNGAALSMVCKMQTLTAPSTCWAESVTLFDTSTDVLGIRNLMAELGQFQEEPTRIYCDNTSAIQIANNRGSLGKSSRAMDLKTLCIRNRIEDHLVQVDYIETKDQVADQGTKALGENPFVRLRDTMNGYAIVKAAYPDKLMPDLVFELEGNGKRGSQKMINSMVAMLSQFQFLTADKVNQG